MMQTYKVSEEDAEFVRKELDKIIQGYKRIILYPYGSIGRYAGEALSPSFSASSGQDTSGPLALMNSAVCSDMSKFGNGMALDIRFTKSFLKKMENRDKLVEIIEGYFEKGGMEIQINCFDSEELRDAQIHPEKYKDLVVRVAGFSAYFIRLDEALQNEIIRRNANEVM